MSAGNQAHDNYYLSLAGLDYSKPVICTLSMDFGIVVLCVFLFKGANLTALFNSRANGVVSALNLIAR